MLRAVAVLAATACAFAPAPRLQCPRALGVCELLGLAVGAAACCCSGIESLGHRHLPLDLEVPRPAGATSSQPARYINLGDWIQHFTCGKVVDGTASLLYL